jgi:imidazolonepropionase-like amidohydrolase
MISDARPELPKTKPLRRVMRATGLLSIGAALTAAGLLAVGLALPLAAIPDFGRAMPAYVVTNIAVVDVDAGRLLHGMAVAVANGRIVAVGKAAMDARYATWPIIDGYGRYLMPGLWDSHLHTVELSSRLHFPLLLANGVTTVRNMGDGCSWRSAFDCPPDAQAWSQDGANGEAILPAIVATTGHHVEDLATIAEIPPLLLGLRQRGERIVKIQLGDDVSPEVVAALFAAAGDAGLAIAGHFPEGADLGDTRFAALVSLEHDNQLRPQCRRQTDGCAALLAVLAQRRTAYVPTHVASAAQDARLGSAPEAEAAALAFAAAPVALLWRAYRALHRAGIDAATQQQYGRELAEAFRLTRAANQVGVRVLAGTDALDPFILHGDALHDELALLHAAGMDTADVLRAATIRPAEHFGWSHRKGRIAPGYDADMVMLDANPLADIGATRRIVGVMKDDRVFKVTDLAALRRFAQAQAGDLAVNARAWWALLAG